MSKISKQDKIRAENLIEEVSETLETCIKCGMCKSLCPVFKILREEAVSPRGKAIILSDKILNNIIFQCNLCKACEEKCPLKIKVCDSILKAREAMVLQGNELKQNKEMVENFKKYDNPIGKPKQGENQKLYCC